MTRKTDTRSLLLLAGALFLGLLGLAGWAIGQADGAAAEAGNKVEEVVRQRGIVARLKATPGAAAGARDIGSTVEQALQAAGIPQSKLLLTSPSTPKPQPGTKQAVQETEIVLKELTLGQLVPFLIELEHRVPGLRLAELHLSGSGQAAQWSVRVTVAQTVATK